MIANVEHILESHFSLSNIDLIILFGMLGGALILGIITMGHLSDKLRKRKPFIVSGLISFGFLATILIAYADNFEAVWEIWPALPILGFIAGGFPPAAMAYLTDISEEDSRGSTMGVYSIFFGTGMIIGPLSGLFVYASYGLLGFIVLIAIFIVIACIGTYFMPEIHGHEAEPVSEIDVGNR